MAYWHKRRKARKAYIRKEINKMKLKVSGKQHTEGSKRLESRRMSFLVGFRHSTATNSVIIPDKRACFGIKEREEILSRLK